MVTIQDLLQNGFDEEGAAAALAEAPDLEAVELPDPLEFLMEGVGLPEHEAVDLLCELPGPPVQNAFYSGAQRKWYFGNALVTNEGWRTIRGARVFIGKGGKIEKGPKALAGKSLSDFGKGGGKAPGKDDSAKGGGTAKAGEAVAKEPTTAPPPGKYFAPDVTKDANKDGVTDAARVGVPAHDVPPPPKVPRLPNLTRAERKAESDFAKAFEADPDKMARDYLEIAKAEGPPPKFETDAAKLLSSAWVDADQNKQAVKRAHFNTALHQTANAVTKRAFLQHLDTLKPGDEIMVTCGGCGAGKGFCLKKIPETIEMKKNAKAVWDSAGDQNSTENTWLLEEAKKRGLKLNLAYVHADPKVSWAHPEAGVVQRAQNPKDGRMVDAAVFADSYAHGAKNMQAFIEKHGKDPDVSVTILKNEIGKDPVKLDKIPEEAFVDRDKLHEFALATIAERETIPPHIKRGATVGERIWKAD